MSFKVKIDNADRLFSEYIRRRDGKCVRCGRTGRPNANGHPILGLQASHYHGRRKEATRFDPENVDAVCSGCHQYWGENREKYTAWKREQLGENGFFLLEIRSKSYHKKDRAMEVIRARELLKTFDESRLF